MPLPPGAKARGPEALARCRREYGERYCFLDHGSDFQLLVAVILSAQSTDAAVNKLTPGLFAAYPTPQAMMRAPFDDLNRLVRTVTYHRSKTQYLLDTSRILVERHGGKVPRAMEDLVALPGVARKTANVVKGYLWGDAEGIAVDTHVGRVARRLGLTREEDPVKVELDLMRVFPREDWLDVTFHFISHGRAICDARKPKCGECLLKDICPKVGVDKKWVAESYVLSALADDAAPRKKPAKRRAKA